MAYGTRVLFLFILLVLIPLSFTSTYYVNGTGAACGTGDGYYSTIQAAIDDAGTVDGDTIIICRNGTSGYTENILITKSINLYGNESYVLVTAANSSDSLLTIDTANDVNLTNLTLTGVTEWPANALAIIKGNRTHAYGLNISGDVIGIQAQDSVGLNISYNVLTGTADPDSIGIGLGNVNNSWIGYNNISGTNNSGIWTCASNNTFIFNRVNNTMNGIYINSSEVNNNCTTQYNNRFLNNTITVTSLAFWLGEYAHYSTVYGNYIVSSGQGFEIRSSWNNITRNRARYVEIGFSVGNSQGNRIWHNAVVNATYGFYFLNLTNSTLLNNSAHNVTENGGGTGLILYNSSNNTLTYNNLSDNVDIPIYISGLCGGSTIDTTNVGLGGLPINYTNDATDYVLSGSITGFSDFILCNITNLLIENVSFVGGNAITVVNSPNVSIRNYSTTDSKYGFWASLANVSMRNATLTNNTLAITAYEYANITLINVSVVYGSATQGILWTADGSRTSTKSGGTYYNLTTSLGNFVFDNAVNVYLLAANYSLFGLPATGCGSSGYTACELVSADGTVVQVNPMQGWWSSASDARIDLGMYYDTGQTTFSESQIKIAKYSDGWIAVGQTDIDAGTGLVRYDNITSFSYFGVAGFIPAEANGGEEKGTLNLQALADCSGGQRGINITVTSDKERCISGVDIILYKGKVATTQNYVDETTTNDSGNAIFSGLENGEYTVTTEKTNCIDDTESVMLNCECPEPQANAIITDEYTCEWECKEGYSMNETGACVKPVEIPPVVTGGCTSDADCASNEYCSTGNCKPVTGGECGYAENHQWVGYECCADSDCKSAIMKCVEHKCVLKEYTIEMPKNATVGDNITIKAFENGKTIQNVSISIKLPTGASKDLKTNENGEASLLIEYEGKYVASLLGENKVLESASLQSLPKAAVEEGVKKPPALWEQENVKNAGVVALILIGLVAAAYIYFKRKKIF